MFYYYYYYYYFFYYFLNLKSHKEMSCMWKNHQMADMVNKGSGTARKAKTLQSAYHAVSRVGCSDYFYIDI